MIQALFFYIINKSNRQTAEITIISSLVSLLVVLILLVYLYINNIIGLPNMILLMLISIFILNPMGLYTGVINIILIPIIYFLSLHFRKLN
jgi:hypothetical protein